MQAPGPMQRQMQRRSPGAENGGQPNNIPARAMSPAMGGGGMGGPGMPRPSASSRSVGGGSAPGGGAPGARRANVSVTCRLFFFFFSSCSSFAFVFLFALLCFAFVHCLVFGELVGFIDLPCLAYGRRSCGRTLLLLRLNMKRSCYTATISAAPVILVLWAGSVDATVFAVRRRCSAVRLTVSSLIANCTSHFSSFLFSFSSSPYRH